MRHLHVNKKTTSFIYELYYTVLVVQHIWKKRIISHHLCKSYTHKTKHLRKFLQKAVKIQMVITPFPDVLKKNPEMIFHFSIMLTIYLNFRFFKNPKFQNQEKNVQFERNIPYVD